MYRYPSIEGVPSEAYLTLFRQSNGKVANPYFKSSRWQQVMENLKTAGHTLTVFVVFTKKKRIDLIVYPFLSCSITLL
ncbi:hypothetical protein PMI05_04523 [Brevibacillus sp. BC25]|nr:hypothetical protein PMI05_04523 [Brevibacillus sp. BC25]